MNSKDRVTNNLVALGSAAVLTVYAAGFVRTRPAAQRFAQLAERRPVPSTPMATEIATPAPASISHDDSPPGAHTVEVKPDRAATETKPAVHAKPSTPTLTGVADSVVTTPVVAPATVTAPVAAIPVATAAVAAPPVAAPTRTPAPTPTRDTSRAASAPVADSTQSGEKEKAKLKDGIFFGWGTSRHGDIQAGLEVKNGRIISAFISECLTQYSCSWIERLPAQVIARQSPDVDFVSGATQSTNAFYYAVADALKKAK